MAVACFQEEDTADLAARYRRSKRAIKEGYKVRRTTAGELAKKLKISKSRGLEAILKAELISAILKSIKEEELTHAELAVRSGLPRSAVTGILSGSLQRVTVDRVLRLLEAAGLTLETRVTKAA
jgi:predicted XRE-type DNA-binding protein